MNKDVFFEEIGKSLFNGRLSPGQREGMEVKLAAFDVHGTRDDRWRAYMLATSYHETGHTMQPVEEVGKGRGKPYGTKRKHDGTAYTYPDRLYFGRGDVQLTWYENYERMGKLLGIPLLEQPGLALEPGISARIMIEGMTRGISNRGDFTGVSLEDYFNDRVEDPDNARRVVSGLDKSYLITSYYRAFLAALRKAMATVVALLPVFLLPVLLFAGTGCQSSRAVTERVVTRVDSTAVQVLTDSLYRQERVVASLQTILKRAREENTRLSSETRQHAVFYDTAAPLDTLTGKRPVSSEVVTTTSSRYEQAMEDEEERQSSVGSVHESLFHENRALGLTVDKLTLDNKELTRKTTVSGLNFKQFLIGLVAGIVVGIAATLRLNKARSSFPR